MARIRSIKPEFWTDSSVGEVSPSARLLFIASWNFADDKGGLDRSAKQLKAQAFPYDVIDCEPLILELLGAGLLLEYVVDGKKYLHIKGFLKHQKIENPSKARIPPYEESSDNHRRLTEESPRSQGPLIGREGKGNGKGREREYTEARVDRPDDDNDIAAAAEADLKDNYPRTTHRCDWTAALHTAAKMVSDGEATWAQLLAGVLRLRAYVQAGGYSGPGFVPAPQNFLVRTKQDVPAPWSLPWDPPLSKAQKQQDANAEAAKQWLAGSAA